MGKKYAIIILFLISQVTQAQTISQNETQRAFLGNSSMTESQMSEENEPKKIICPPLSDYIIPLGYRLAGLSPSCQAVVVPTAEMDEGLVDRNEESQQYQFTYGQALDPYRYNVYP